MNIGGIPLELLGGLASGLFGFFAKAQANAMEGMKQVAEMSMKANSHNSGLADAAAKRSSPKARKVLAYIIVGTFVFGLIVWAIIGLWQPDAVVSLVAETDQKEFLWGLFKWGGGQEVTEARGFVLPPWTGWVVSVVVGFFFGTGAAKPAK